MWLILPFWHTIIQAVIWSIFWKVSISHLIWKYWFGLPWNSSISNHPLFLGKSYNKSSIYLTTACTELSDRRKNVEEVVGFTKNVKRRKHFVSRINVHKNDLYFFVLAFTPTVSNHSARYIQYIFFKQILKYWAYMMMTILSKF